MAFVTVGSEPKQSKTGSQLLHKLFEKNARRRGSHPAVTFGDQTLTYSELDGRANQYAKLFRARGVGVGDLVAIHLEKSCELFACILGALKAGAGYVPIDTKFPAERVRGIVEDAGTSLVVTQQDKAETFAGREACTVLTLEEARRALRRYKKQRLPRSKIPVSGQDICYVIYTSGSTGRPKGVVIEHRNAVNFARSLETVYRLDETDRIYQGFSIAFDAAVEEVWGAFALGGTLVVAPDDVSRSPADAAAFINDQEITFFSTVPTFLSQITCDLPTIKLLILGGEACSAKLANRWTSKGYRILNTYGPTETTVVTTAAELAPGKPVTIGKPLPGYTAYVLGEDMTPVNAGETGELYVGGLSVARGYMNRPELTAERFIANPLHEADGTDPVLYRTHDLVRLEPNGEFTFVGRADDQIKIRGFRVELSEIEAVLQESPAVKVAAVKVVERNGMQEIAAYAVETADGALDREEIAVLLRQRLPDYMVPKYLDVIAAMPTMTSGKTDRKQLPAPEAPLGGKRKTVTAPATTMERLVMKVFERSTGISPVSVDDDFFLDLGGHSLMAAHTATMLRARLDGISISVRDLYQHPTARDLARHCESVSEDAGHHRLSEQEERERDRERESATVSRWMKWTCTGLQGISMLVYYALATAPITYLIIMVLSVLDGRIAAETAVSASIIATFAYWPSMLLLSIALKWLVIGRYKPGRYPIWSFYYFRWWLVTRFQGLSWSEMFMGTPLMSLYFRLMGADVGRNCSIRTAWCAAFDLVSLGDNASIGSETQLLGYRVEDGFLVLGRVDVGRDCFVGMHSCLGLDVTMGDGARLDDMSLLPDGTVLAPGEARRGSPAERAEVATPRRAGTTRRKRRPFLFGLIQLGLIYVMGYFLIATLVPSTLLIGSALYYWGMAWGAVAAFASVPVAVATYIMLLVAMKRLFIGRLKPGLYPLESWGYLRHWFMDYLMNNTRAILSPLYATLFLPPVLRLLGAKIGRNVEFSTVMYVAPDLIEIGEGSFCADVCIVGGMRVHDGVAEIQVNRIGERSFVGNSAFVPGGVDIGDDCLIGALSTPPAGAQAVPDGTRWLGAPGFPLPRGRQKPACFGADLTYSPTLKLRAARFFIELARIMLPGLLGVAGLVAYAAGLVAAYHTLPLWAVVLLAPALAIAIAVAGVAASAGIKKLLIGRYEPLVRPLWSPFVWLNEVVNAVYETVAASAMVPMLGTPFIAPCLRMMGCKIGKDVFLETTLFSEFDLVEIGDHAALNFGVTVQTHLFEDRVLKTDHLKIGEHCSVGNMSVVLYETQMQKRSALKPLSLLMKGETLPRYSGWQGIPCQQVREAAPVSLQRLIQDLDRLELPVAAE